MPDLPGLWAAKMDKRMRQCVFACEAAKHKLPARRPRGNCIDASSDIRGATTAAIPIQLTQNTW
eukprot:1917006-Alexandrium_andersonii.AAC.1